jgi:centractin
MSLTFQPVVIDNGTGIVKAGVAGEERPKAVFRTMVGRPKHKRIMAGGALEGELYGLDRGLLKIRVVCLVSMPWFTLEFDDSI